MIIKKAIKAYLKGIDQFQGQQYLTLISDSQKEAILLPKCHLAVYRHFCFLQLDRVILIGRGQRYWYMS